MVDWGHIREFGNEPARSLISIHTILTGLLSSFQKVKVVSLGGSQSSPRTLLGEGFPFYIEAAWEIISSVAKPFLIFLNFSHIALTSYAYIYIQRAFFSFLTF